MRTSLFLLSLAIASVSGAESIGLVDSPSAFTVQAASGTSSEVTGKQVLQPGQTLNAGHSMVRAFASETEFAAVLSPKASLKVISANAYELTEGSVVTSGKEFAVSANGLTCNAGTDSTTAVVHRFGEKEVSINVVEGNMTVVDAKGNALGTLEKGQSLVLVNQGTSWTSQPTQTGAPSFSQFLAQVDGGEGTGPQQTVEQNDEDRRRLLLLLLAGAGAAAAGTAGYVVYDNTQNDNNNDNNNNDEENSFRSPFIIGGTSAFVQ